MTVQLALVPEPVRTTRCRDMAGWCWTREAGKWDAIAPRGRCSRGYGQQPTIHAACAYLRGTTGHLDPCWWFRDMDERRERERRGT
jgi:hypothetical protein